jgi:lipoate-protein ligase A
VVIGRNQCASAECDVERLERDGGHLARRRSGGGAVYHDLGNLCFTFVCVPEEYDQAAQTNVILDAVRSLGIVAERTGRNDLVVEGGRKFSGHAYQHTGAASCHHGTIMVAVDVDALGRYLTVSPLKLQAKGVRSVRSRVTNLQAIDSGITVDALKGALREAFAASVGCRVKDEDEGALDQREIALERERFASRTWLYKGERRFGESRQARFDWGSFRVDLTRKAGAICDLVVFSDGLDAERIERIPELLVGALADAGETETRLRAGGFANDMAADIAHLIQD